MKCLVHMKESCDLCSNQTGMFVKARLPTDTDQELAEEANKHPDSVSTNLANHTCGPWEWWTSNSWKRLKNQEGESVAEPYVCWADNHPDLDVSEDDRALIQAAPAMYQRLVYAERLLLQEDYEGALKEIRAGLAGNYESEDL